MRWPKGRAATDVAWGVIGLCVAAWYVVDSGIWDRLTPFWRWVVCGMGAFEAKTIVDRWKGNTLSEGIWRYLPTRPLIAWAFAVLGNYLFGPLTERDIWYLLMGHFIFYAAPMSREELFRAALKSYADLQRLLDKYRDLAPNAPATAAIPPQTLGEHDR